MIESVAFGRKPNTSIIPKSLSDNLDDKENGTDVSGVSECILFHKTMP